MWLWLAQIMFIHIGSAMIMMMSIVMLVVIMMMVTMINMTKLSPIVRVHKQAGKGSGRNGRRQTQHGRQRKHDNHGPNQGNVASAHSFQLRQHRLSFFATVDPSP
jgi:predicted lipid-binding transport protein (Tim44 family)